MSLQNKGGFCSVTVRSNPKQTTCQTSVFVMQYTFISIRYSVEKGWKYTSGTCQVSHCDLVNKEMLICPQFHCSNHKKIQHSLSLSSLMAQLLNGIFIQWQQLYAVMQSWLCLLKTTQFKDMKQVVKLVELLLVPQVWTLHSELSLRGSLIYYQSSNLTICHLILCHQSVMALSHSTHFLAHKSWQEPLR